MRNQINDSLRKPALSENFSLIPPGSIFRFAVGFGPSLRGVRLITNILIVVPDVGCAAQAETSGVRLVDLNKVGARDGLQAGCEK